MAEGRRRSSIQLAVDPGSNEGGPASRPGSISLFNDARRVYDSELAGVEGSLGANVTGFFRDAISLSRASSAMIDEAELVEYCQQEARERAECKRTGAVYKPGKLFLPKGKEHVERLHEEMEQYRLRNEAQGMDTPDFRSQVFALVKKYHIEMPTITVHYKDICVETDALVGSAGIPTVGNSFMNILKKLVGMKPPTANQRILTNISGVLVPGRVTLLLGPPSSGKSSFLKVLAGRYQHKDTLRVQGNITYNGHTFDQFCVNRTSAFIGQNDVHIPLLSVFDTLMFAYVCQQGFRAEDFNVFAELRQAIANSKSFKAREGSTAPATEVTDDCKSIDDLAEQLLALGEKVYLSGVKVLNMMRAFGIFHTKDTPVGDAMLRGVSGGERKRVTLTEMVVGPRRIMFMDEISTGLDSATLYSIVSQIRDFCHTFQITCMVSLLQPPPEVYHLFDDLCLMSAGSVVYHGPVGGAKEFFTNLGFVCPPRKDVPSFLQEVTTPSGQLEFAGPELLKSKGITKEQQEHGTSQFLIPTEDMVNQYWTTTQAGRDMQALVNQSYDSSKEHPAALVKTEYALGPLQALMVVTRMQLKLVIKDPVLIKGRLIQITIIGLLVGGLFFQLPRTLAGSRTTFGALFLSVMFIAMGSMPQLAITMAYKPVWYKWRDNQFYPGWVHATASALAQVPVSIIDTLFWSLIVYWMWGLHASAQQYFIHWFILFATNISCAALFRLIAHLAPDGVAANSFGGLMLLILILMSGFSIVRGSIPDWWIWAYYISPFAWALRSVVINEFTAPSWDAPSPITPGRTLGEEAMLTFDFYTEKKWMWAGIGYLFASAVAFTVLSGFALQYLTPRTVSRVEDEEEVEAARQQALEVKRAAAEKEAARQQAEAACQEAMASARKARADGKVHHTDAECATACQLLGECVVNVAAPSIPFTPITLVYQNLKYFVPNPGYKKGAKDAHGDDTPEELELLKGITGFAEPGMLTALMGGSGAGKTTLMDVIAGRKTVGRITGDITVNGHPKDQKTWSRVVGYCEQMDIHTPAQTVKEALVFSARLRLPESVSQSQVDAYIEDVMSIVELTPIQFNLVGLLGNGLNVEQRKRLTIGVELVANPSVVFMDEPTSGLDARAAAIVMRAVRNVARNNRAVLVTIHQPSIEIFEAFDQLLLLQRGGRTTYFGPLGHESVHLVDYLQSVPGCPPISAGYNPATYMLEVTGGAVSVMAKAVEADWPEVYKSSALCKSNAERAVQLVAQGVASHPVLTVEGDEYASSFRTQWKGLMKKYTMAYWRTPSYNFTRFMVTILVAILYGSIYYSSGSLPTPAALKDVQNVMGVIFSCTSFMGMTNMMAAMPILGLERVVFYRERAASMYSPWAYSLVLSAVEMPYIISQVVLFVCILYPLVGFTRTAQNFFWYMLLTFQSIAFYTAFGMFLTYITPSQQLAQVAAAGLNFIFNIFNGFIITYPALPRGWRWLNRVTPTTWILYGLAADQLAGSDTPMNYPQDKSIKTVGQFMSVVFGFEYDFHWWTPLILLAYLFFLRVGAVLALRFVSFLRR